MFAGMPDEPNQRPVQQAVDLSDTFARAERVIQQGLERVARTDRRIQKSLSIVRYSTFLRNVERRYLDFLEELV